MRALRALRRWPFGESAADIRERVVRDRNRETARKMIADYRRAQVESSSAAVRVLCDREIRRLEVLLADGGAPTFDDLFREVQS